MNTHSRTPPGRTNEGGEPDAPPAQEAGERVATMVDDVLGQAVADLQAQDQVQEARALAALRDVARQVLEVQAGDLVAMAEDEVLQVWEWGRAQPMVRLLRTLQEAQVRLRQQARP